MRGSSLVGSAISVYVTVGNGFVAGIRERNVRRCRSEFTTTTMSEFPQRARQAPLSYFVSRRRSSDLVKMHPQTRQFVSMSARHSTSWMLVVTSFWSSTEHTLKPRPSVPAAMLKQHYRMLYKVECCFDKVERCLDIVTSTPATMSKQRSTLFSERVFREILPFRQIRNKLNMFNLFRICRKDEISPKTRSTLLPKSAIKSNAASTLVTRCRPNGT